MRKRLFAIFAVLHALCVPVFAISPEQLNAIREKALLGDTHALFVLGQIYENGDGVPADKNIALCYFRAAAHLGDDAAKAKVASLVVGPTRVQIEQMEHTLMQQREERNRLVKEEGLLTSDMGTANSELANVISVRDAERKNYEDQLAIRNEIQKAKAAGQSLLSQPAITSNALVATLLPRVADLRISITGLLEKYGKNHPTLIAQTQQLEQAEAELAEAVKKAESEFETSFINSKRRYESAQHRAEEKEAQLVRLRDAISQLAALDKQISLNEELLQRLKFNLEDLKNDYM